MVYTVVLFSCYLIYPFILVVCCLVSSLLTLKLSFQNYFILTPVRLPVVSPHSLNYHLLLTNFLKLVYRIIHCKYPLEANNNVLPRPFVHQQSHRRSIILNLVRDKQYLLSAVSHVYAYDRIDKEGSICQRF